MVAYKTRTAIQMGKTAIADAEVVNGILIAELEETLVRDRAAFEAKGGRRRRARHVSEGEAADACYGCRHANNNRACVLFEMLNCRELQPLILSKWIDTVC